MLDYTKLRAISTEDLRALNTMICAEIKSRNALKSMHATRTLMPGMRATYRNSRTGETMLVKIREINRVNVIADEIDTNGNFLKSWRIAARALTPV